MNEPAEQPTPTSEQPTTADEAAPIDGFQLALGLQGAFEAVADAAAPSVVHLTMFKANPDWTKAGLKKSKGRDWLAENEEDSSVFNKKIFCCIFCHGELYKNMDMLDIKNSEQCEPSIKLHIEDKEAEITSQTDGPDCKGRTVQRWKCGKPHGYWKQFHLFTMPSAPINEQFMIAM